MTIHPRATFDFKVSAEREERAGKQYRRKRESLVGEGKEKKLERRAHLR